MEEGREGKPIKIVLMVFEFMLCSTINSRTFHAHST